MTLGLVTGVVLNLYFIDLFEILDNYVFSFVGDLFINAIKMVIVPLVFFSIVAGVSSIGETRKLGRISLKTVALYLLTTAIAITIALGIANVVQPGDGVDVASMEEATKDKQAETEQKKPEEEKSPVEMITSMIPQNPVAAMAEGSMLQIIIFALFFGVGISALGEKAQRVREFVEQANEVMMKLVDIIMKTVPYAAFALIASAVGKAGVDLIGSMFIYMACVLGALIVHAAVTYGSFIAVFAKMNPLNFFRKMAPAMEVAFSTSSSAATLPVTMNCVENGLKVPKSVSRFVLPLGATINMDGTSIMQGVAALFIAQLYGWDLGLTAQLTIILTATLASIGTAAVPSAGIVMLFMVLGAIDLPSDQIVTGLAIVFGVDRLLDMSRTAINITGDAMVATCVAKSEGAELHIEKETSQTA